MKKQNKYRTHKKSPSLFKRFLGFLFMILVVFGILHYKYGESILGEDFDYSQDPIKITPWEQVKLNSTIQHYKNDVIKNAQFHKLPPSYLLALIALESSGKKTPKSRFEPKIYDRLKDCRDGKTNSFGTLKRKRLKNLSDGALKNLASSWGPFQLMGYHAYELGIYVNDIRGKEAVKFGIIWIDSRYGNDLKNKNYKNAFHIHNTGRPFPKSGKPFTHDPDYIVKGLKYVEYFEEKL